MCVCVCVCVCIYIYIYNGNCGMALIKAYNNYCDRKRRVHAVFVKLRYKPEGRRLDSR